MPWWIWRTPKAYQFPPVILCWLSAVWSHKKQYRTLHFNWFHSNLFCCCCSEGWSSLFSLSHHVGECSVLLVVSDGVSIRGEFITKVLGQEGIKKGSWWDCVPMVPGNPHLVVSWWRNLGEWHLKSSSFLAVITYWCIGYGQQKFHYSCLKMTNIGYIC